MEINLDDLTVCKNCGIVIDVTFALKEYDTADYYEPVG